jgi:hypothetical protein
MSKKRKNDNAEGNRKKEKRAARRNSVTVEANLSLYLIIVPCAYMVHWTVKV